MHVRRACRGVVPEPAPEARELAVALRSGNAIVAAAVEAQEPAGAQPSGAAEPKPTVDLLRWRAKWYASGCDGIGDLDGYQRKGLAEDAASDLTAALDMLASAQQERDEARQRERETMAACVRQIEDANAFKRHAVEVASKAERDSAQAQIATLTIQRNGTLLALEDAQAQIAALTARAEQLQREADETVMLAECPGVSSLKELAQELACRAQRIIALEHRERAAFDAAWDALESFVDGYYQPFDREAEWAAYLAASTPAADTPMQKE
jgi:hypothetical protein